MDKPSVPDEEFLIYLKFQLNHMVPIETNNIVFLNADEGKDQILEISKGEVEQEED